MALGLAATPGKHLLEDSAVCAGLSEDMGQADSGGPVSSPCVPGWRPSNSPVRLPGLELILAASPKVFLLYEWSRSGNNIFSGKLGNDVNWMH